MSSSTVSPVRRIVVRLTIGSFSLAALMGVAALLRPGRFGSTEGRILLTTLVVGVTSVLMLCYLAAPGDHARLIAFGGAAAALFAATCALLMFWAYWQHDPPTGLLRTFGVSGVVALTLAQFSLLLAVVRRRPSVVRLFLATVVAGTTLAGLVIAAILGWNPGDAAARLIGVVAILDVLGTVVTMALGVFGGRPETSFTVPLGPDVAARLRQEADRTGRPVDQLVTEAVEHYLKAPRS